jgi:hypothetical protein
MKIHNQFATLVLFLTLIVAAGLLIMTGITACDTGGGNDAPDGISVTLTHGDCTSNKPMIGANPRIAEPDCLEYTCDGDSVLHLRHHNAAFNCCPGDLTAEVTVEGTNITITEHESQAECDCDCLYDLDYTITGLQAGQYTITVNEPYVPAGDPLLQCAISLLPDHEGKCCLDRPYYPWDMD